MRVLSLFSGIGGFDLGLERAGMEVVGQVEIDPYCRKVLARHWPDVRRWTDVRAVSRESLGLVDGERERGGSAKRGEPQLSVRERDAEQQSAQPQRQSGAVDLICGGFPCQDLSVAGKRAGLDGDRSGLWFEFQRILSELRPRWAVIENVPGLLSSNGGRDFAVILDGLGECGFGGIAWAVLDSQHFGVAQRRRRVFIVCGPTRRSAEQVLSLCESCGGHPQTSRTPGQDAPAEVGVGVARSLRARANASHREDSDTYIPDVSPSLTQRDYKSQREDIAEPAFVAIRTAQTSANGHGIAEDMAHTLDGANGQAIARTLRADGFDASEDGTGRGTPLVAVQEAQAGVREYATAGSLRSDAPGTQPGGTLVRGGASVRRLTPVECARLQGFPDDWLDGADGPQYRAFGNAVTVPVIEWIGRRIMEAKRLEAT